MESLKSYADPEKIYENSTDLQKYADIESKEEAIRVAEYKIEQEEIETNEAKICLQSSLNDDIQVEDFEAKIEEDNIELDGSYRRNMLEERCYKAVSMTGAFTYFSLLLWLLAGVLFYIWFAISSISIAGEISYFNEYINVGLGLLTITTVGILQVMMWYPRNLNQFNVDIKYNNKSLYMLIGSLNIFVLPIAWYFNLDTIGFILILLTPIFALFADSTMINDQVKYYMGLKEKEDDFYGEKITHNHLPKGMYQFNIKRRAFLWFSVTVSIIASVIWVELPQNLLYDIVFGIIILMPYLVMVQYLRYRSDIEKLVYN